MGFLLCKFEEVVTALHHEAKGQPWRGEHITGLVSWTTPHKGWVVFNTDGASKGNPGSAGGGGVLRGDRGEWKWAFTENMGYCSSMKAELKAILRGLRIAKEKGVSRLLVRSDSTVLVGMLRGEMEPNPEHGALIEQCKRLVQEESWKVQISHCYREANKVADMLANIGVTLNNKFTFFDSPPPTGGDGCTHC